MFTLEELTQLVAFVDYGTLSKAAEALHISQPTITRTMQSLEESFGCSLFTRSKNKIALNDTGMQAVSYARTLLHDAQQMIKNVRAYDRSLRTITVESCAPAPLWSLVPELNQKHTAMMISSSLDEIDHILQHVRDGLCDIGVVLAPPKEEDIIYREYQTESLNICLPEDHPALKNHPKSLTFREINGYNCLLKSEIGFWADLCHAKMPSTRFLVQTDDFAFQELVNNSTLPFFSTNLSRSSIELNSDRVEISLSDPEATVTYYLITRKNNRLMF